MKKKELQKSRVEKITALHTEIGGYLKTTLSKAIEIGGILIEIKTDVQHGGWLPWINENLPFSARLATDYIRFHENRDDLKTARLADLAAAREFLLPEKTPAPPVETDTEREKRIEKRRIAHEEEDNTVAKIEKEYRKTPDTKRRIDSETVTEHIARRETVKEENKKIAKARRDAIDEMRLVQLQKDNPDNKVSKKGIHYQCSLCKKHVTDPWSIKRLEGEPICHACKNIAELTKAYPGRTIKRVRMTHDGGSYWSLRVQFTCEQCGKDFFDRGDVWGNIKQFCSDYCGYVAGLKTSPQWERKEWNTVKEWEKTQKQERWYRTAFNAWQETDEEQIDLGDPNSDSKQAALFDALDVYFGGFEDVNRRLNALHNLIKKLKHIGSDYQVETVNEESDEILAIESKV